MPNSKKHTYFAPLPTSIFEYAEKQPLLQDPKTRTRYRAQWNRMLARFPDRKPADRVLLIYKNLTERANLGQFSPSTFRQHKAAFLFGLSSMVTIYGEIQPAFDDGYSSVEFYESMYELTLKHRLKKFLNSGKYQILRTSAKKLKGFPKEIFDWLQNQDSHSRPALRRLQLFLRVNLLLGLRPSEWCDVQIANNVKDGEPVLVVRNFKNSFGRANGDYRILLLAGITEQEKIDILKFKIEFERELKSDLQNFKEKCNIFYAKDPDYQYGLRALGQQKLDAQYGLGKTWNPEMPDVPLEELVDEYGNIQHELAHRKMSNLQRVLYLELKKCQLFKSDDQFRPTLYSTRHQAIANAKKSKLSIVEIAAFFGHASVSTASTHYAKSGAGWSKFRFAPDQDCVALVHVSNINVLDKKVEPPRPVVGEEFDLGW